MGFQRFYLIAGAFFCVKLVGEGYAVSFRLGAPGDAGMVPLSLREIAKGGKKMIQLAALKQVSSFFQRSHPRAKRKPDPRIKARHPGASPLGSCGSECEESIFYKEIVWLGKITVGKVRGKLWGFREISG